MTIKRIALALVLVGLTGLAYYSYGRLNFGERTGMFFRTALGGEQPGGRIPPGVDSTRARQSPDGGPTPGAGGKRGTRPVRGRTSGPGPQTGPAAAQPPSTEAETVDGVEGPVFAGRSLEGQRRAGAGPGQSGPAEMSLENVLGYAVILAFVTMLTVLTDAWLQALTKRRRPVRQLG